MAAVWTFQTTPFDSGLGVGRCAWSNGLGLFVLTGQSADGLTAIATSPDGVTWTGRGNPWNSGGSGLGSDVVWSPALGVFCAVGTSGDGSINVVTSPDGVTWTPQTTPFDGGVGLVSLVEWSNDVDLFVAGGAKGSGTQALMTSPDGVTWTAQTTPFDAGFVSQVAWASGLGLFVAGGNDGGTGLIMTSPDGAVWTPQTTPLDAASPCQVIGVTWAPLYGVLMAEGLFTPATNVVMTSFNATVWTAQTTPIDGGGATGITGIEVAGPTLVLGSSISGPAQEIQRSTDSGTTWVGETSPFDNNGWASTFAYDAGDDILVAAGPTDGAHVLATFAEPTPPPPPPVVGGRFYSPPDWRFIVTRLDGKVLTFLDPLALERTATYTLNKAADAVMGVPSDNPEVNLVDGGPDGDGDPFVAMGNRLLYGFRRDGPRVGACADIYTGPWTPRFGGILMQPNDEINVSTDVPTTHITAYDPYQYLMSQPVVGAGGLPGKKGLSFNNTAGNVILLELLENLLTYNLALVAGGFPMPLAAQCAFLNWGQSRFLGVDYGASPNPYYCGNVIGMDPTVEVSVNFKQGTMLGDAIKTLTDDMGAFDFIIDASYDPGTTGVPRQPGILGQLNLYQQAGSNRYDAVFAWDMPSHSLSGVNRLMDGQQMVNIEQAYFGQGGAPATPTPLPNPASIAKFGPYWLMQFYPSLNASPATVVLLAAAQLALRQMGKVSLTVDAIGEISPVPFQQYFLGDNVPVYASRNFRQPIAPCVLGAAATGESSPTLPLTVVAAVNDEFVYDGNTYTVAPGVYISLEEVILAVEAASGSPSLSSVLSVDSADGIALTLTAAAFGMGGTVLNAGGADILTDLGFEDGDALGGAEAWGCLQRVYSIPVTIPDNAPEQVLQVLMTVPDLTST